MPAQRSSYGHPDQNVPFIPGTSYSSRHPYQAMLSQQLALEIPKSVVSLPFQHLLPHLQTAMNSSFVDESAVMGSSSPQSDSPCETVEDDDHPTSPLSSPGGLPNYQYVTRPTYLESSLPSAEVFGSHYSNASHSYIQRAADISHQAANIGMLEKLERTYALQPPPNSSSYNLSRSRSLAQFPVTSSGNGVLDQSSQQSMAEDYSQQAPLNASLDVQHSSQYEQRRMSEPVMLGTIPAYGSLSTDFRAANRYPPFSFHDASPTSVPRSAAPSYGATLHRGSSFNSLRDVRLHHMSFSSAHSQDQASSSHYEGYQGNQALEESASPSSPDYPSRFASSPGGMVYQSTDDYYGPSPPGTATSTSSNAPALSGHTGYHSGDSPTTSPTDPSKTYSFVSLPGNAVKKRPRRRYDEIERLYQCSWPDCAKAYGTLNHLNAHVSMQKHGPKRQPSEFKELRKQWRKAKKDAELVRTSINQPPEELSPHESPRYISSSHQRHHSHHGAMSGPPITPTLRYSSSADELGLHYRARDRYNAIPPNQWSSNMATSSRSSMYHPYVAGHYTSQPGRVSGETHYQSASQRLPNQPTVLTPVSDYPSSQPPGLLPPLQYGSSRTYTSQYEGYEDIARRSSDHDYT